LRECHLRRDPEQRLACFQSHDSPLGVQREPCVTRSVSGHGGGLSGVTGEGGFIAAGAVVAEM
jgi:hypothetical protein